MVKANVTTTSSVGSCITVCTLTADAYSLTFFGFVYSVEMHGVAS